MNSNMNVSEPKCKYSIEVNSFDKEVTRVCAIKETVRCEGLFDDMSSCPFWNISLKLKYEAK